MRPVLPSVLLCATCLPGMALADFDVDIGGRIQSNIRYRPDDKSVGQGANRSDQGPGFVRNEHILKLRLNAGVDRFSGVIDADFVWAGFTRTRTLDELSFRETVEPNRLELHSAYLDAVDLFVEGLDLRVGQQIVSWGAADQFNPTNNLNADDLEDRLLFGVQQANLMAKLDYTVPDVVTFSGVLVPLFKPALLPKSAVIGLKMTDRLPMVDANLRRRIHAEQAYATSLGFDTRIDETTLILPKETWRNMQFSLRAAFNIGETDVALSYYNGRSDIPLSVGNNVTQEFTGNCDPSDPNDIVDCGALSTTVQLAYPHIQVAGLNIAGEVDLLGWISDDISPIGFRFELGVYFPDEYRMAMNQSTITLVGFDSPAGEYAYPDGERPVVLSDTPYAKWTLGLDYSFNEHWYVNAMWVHGFPDEVGAGDWITAGDAVRQGGVVTNNPSYLLDNCANPLLDGGPSGEVCSREVLRNRIGDYLVLGLDFKWAGGNGMFRMFTIWDLTGYVEDTFDLQSRQRQRNKYSPVSGDGLALVLFPELNYNFGGGFELGAGGLIQLGKRHTKFGDPAAGGSLIWTRARYSF